MDGIMTSRLFTSRQGTIFLGLIAAVVAGVALIVYLNNYRDSVNNNAKGVVLVATQVIEKGTSGDVIASGGFEQVSHDYLKSSIAANAFLDSSALTGLVAVKKIYPGDQLTAADFGPSTNSLTEQLGAAQRAVSVPLGTPQQVGAQVTAGSHVDVWVTLTNAGFPAPTELLIQNAYVTGTSGGVATLRTTPLQAGQIIWGSENGDLWLALRPTVASDLKHLPVISKVGG